MTSLLALILPLFNSLRNPCLVFFFPGVNARVLTCTGGALQATCVRHVQCVLVTERRGGDVCALLSGIALILLNDYWLQPESWMTCVGNTKTDVLAPSSLKQTSMFRSCSKEVQTRFLSFDRRSIVLLICHQTKKDALIYPAPFFIQSSLFVNGPIRGETCPVELQMCKYLMVKIPALQSISTI